MNERNIPILTATTFFLLAVVVVIQFIPQSMPAETNDVVVEKTSDGYQLNLQAVLELAEMDSGNGTVEYRGFNFTGPQLLYIFARGVVMLELNETGKIHVGEYSGPEDPYGFMDTVTLTRSEYTDMAERTYTWMDANGRSPNHVGIYVEGSPDITPSLARKIFRQVLVEYRRTGTLPEVVSA
ncbi:pseudomurein-binding repeat-containing protein [Methanothermobacter wolfeii]|uniref:Pseudomurein-binding repeat-containing protein n=1 Tax=Methanothermobacter wolfeii TaxID=145261 RepID=A0ABU8TV73_METWO